MRLDQSGFDTLKDELGPSRDTSLRRDGTFNENDVDADKNERDVNKNDIDADKKDIDADKNEKNSKYI